MDLKTNDNTINIAQDSNGKTLVLINDIRFKGRRKINWKEVEIYLKEYVGKCYEIYETADKIYIGNDFPSEFCHSKDTKVLMGANAKAKANAAQAIGELIQSASNQASSEDYNKKHGNKAKLGWYRYDIKFALPIYEASNVIERYNVFSARLLLLVRHDKNGHMYLYDILRTKKETSTPLKH